MLEEYLLGNFEDLVRLVNEINSYNGALEHLMVFQNDEEFFELFFNEKPMEAVRSALYGRYNYCDEYVRFDGYENLESFDQYDYEELLRSNIDDIIREFRNFQKDVICVVY